MITTIQIRPASNGYIATVTQAPVSNAPTFAPGNNTDMVFTTLAAVSAYLIAQGFGPDGAAAAAAAAEASSSSTTGTQTST